MYKTKAVQTKENDMSTRHSDNNQIVHFRNKIFEQKSEGWFFNTREGMAFGPYETKQQAIYARSLFVYSLTGDEQYKPDNIEDAAELFMVETCQDSQTL